MAPTKRRSKAKKLPNGALETMFQVEINNAAAPPIGANSPAPVDKGHAALVEPSATPNLARSSDATLAEPANQAPTAPAVSQSSPEIAHPVEDASSNPFLLPQTPCRPPLSSVGAETFPTPSSVADTDDSSGLNDADSPRRCRCHLPTPPARKRGEPRVGRHSPTFRSSSSDKESGKNSKKARDVRTFFCARGDHNSCILCEEKHMLNPNYHVPRYSQKTSTAMLHKHLYECHPDAWVAACDKLGINITAKGAQQVVREYRRRHGEFVPSSQDPEDLRQPFTQDAFVDVLVDLIASEDLSLNIIESPKLRALFLMLREELKDSDIPHRTYLREYIMKTWGDHLDTLQNEMGAALGKILLTADVWSDPNLVPYMAVTSHWIEVKTIQTNEGPHFVLHLRAELIAFHHIEGRHNGVHLASTFFKVLQRVGITAKIGWVTLDNASNNDTMMESLERELKTRGIPFNRITRRIRCFPHVINLGCQAVIKAIEVAFPNFDDTETFMDKVKENPIARLRVLIRTIRASSLRREAFSELSKEQFVHELQLLRDMDVRWSSTFLMIECGLKCKPVIFKFLEQPDFQELRRYELKDEDWEALEAFLDILSIPHEFQQTLSSEKTPTLCDTISHFHAIIQVWKEYQIEHPESHDIVEEGIKKLEEYYDRTSTNPTYVMAMFLNPNIKLNWHYTNAPEDVRSVRETFVRKLRPYYKRHCDAQNQPMHDQAQPPKTPRHGQIPDPSQGPSGRRQTPSRQRATPHRQAQMPRHQPTQPQPSKPNTWASRLYMYTNLAARRSHSTTGTRTLEDKIEAYLLDSQAADSSMGYWQANQHRFPTLFLAALDYLAIQGSAVPCERVFSSAKETITMHRNRMGYDLMEALQMLKFTLRNHRVLDFSVGIMKEAEIFCLEELSDDVFRDAVDTSSMF